MSADWADLDARLMRAAATLDGLAQHETSATERDRLIGKAQGVRLARSYVQEMQR